MSNLKTTWIRVSRANPCPICAKPDWCLISADGTAAICARTESIKPLGEVGWLHKLDGSDIAPYYPPPEYCSTQKPASPDKKHDVYTALLDCLTLNSNHYSDLQRRGLPDEVIAYNGYKTLPSEKTAVLKGISARGVPGAGGVPGFYLGDDGKAALGGVPGLLIPVRDSQQRIVAMQIRRDNAENGGKYVWLSSAEKKRGVGSGSPAHVSIPGDCRTKDTVVITEGPLKADIIAHFLGCVVIGVAGVASWPRAIEVIAGLLPRKVVIAYDNDQLTNEVVRRHANGLEKALLFEHRYTYEAVWPAEHKGLDDYLATGASKLWLGEVKSPPKKHYKETLAKGYKTAWEWVYALRGVSAHIKAPACWPPFSLPSCSCAYCEAARKYNAEVVADVMLGVAA